MSETRHPPRPPHDDRRIRRDDGVRAPGVLLGIGLGGFVDGIVLHQILQWHHMLSSTDGDHVGVPYYPPTTLEGLEVNTLWDGLFHAFAWLTTLAGLVLLHRRGRQPVSGPRVQPWGRSLWAWVLVGWGLFNLVEGVVNHHLLGIHHVRSGPHELAYDLGFLALGVALVVVGWFWQRAGRVNEP